MTPSEPSHPDPMVPPKPPPSDLTSLEDLPGNRWLQAHSPSKFTLQLFAVNRLEQVEQLMSTHPDLHIKILSLEAQTPRYRVLHGIFDSASQAEEAIGMLPPGIREDVRKPLLKSIQELRDEVHTPSREKPGAD